MPGSGINSMNAMHFKAFNFVSIHFSAVKKKATPRPANLFKSDVIGHSNQEEIEKVIQLLS